MLAGRTSFPADRADSRVTPFLTKRDDDVRIPVRVGDAPLVEGWTAVVKAGFDDVAAADASFVEVVGVGVGTEEV